MVRKGGDSSSSTSEGTTFLQRTINVSLTWIIHGHDNCLPREGVDCQDLLIDSVVLKSVSREEDREDLALGTHIQDIPIYHLVLAEFHLKIIKDISIDTWKKSEKKEL